MSDAAEEMVEKKDLDAAEEKARLLREDNESMRKAAKNSRKTAETDKKKAAKEKARLINEAKTAEEARLASEAEAAEKIKQLEEAAKKTEKTPEKTGRIGLVIAIVLSILGVAGILVLTKQYIDQSATSSQVSEVEDLEEALKVSEAKVMEAESAEEARLAAEETARVKKADDDRAAEIKKLEEALKVSEAKVVAAEARIPDNVVVDVKGVVEIKDLDDGGTRHFNPQSIEFDYDDWSHDAYGAFKVPRTIDHRNGRSRVYLGRAKPVPMPPDGYTWLKIKYDSSKTDMPPVMRGRHQGRPVFVEDLWVAVESISLLPALPAPGL